MGEPFPAGMGGAWVVVALEAVGMGGARVGGGAKAFSIN
jgi:hypothetical protein